jgi:hypothetical protein
MSNFVNADQDGLLATVSSRHKSGIEGGVVYQVKDGSASTNLLIKGNEIYGDIGQILNDNDLDALIEVGGEVTDVVIDGNTLKWSGTVSSSERISTSDVINQGIHLYGDVNGAGTSAILIKDNVFDTASIGSNYESSAIYLNTADQGTLGTLKSDVLINDVDNADYANWRVNSTDLGSYIATFSGGSEVSDKLYEVGQTASVYAVRTFADGTSDIGFQQAAYDYSSLIL